MNRCVLLSALAAMLMVSNLANACSVPVFRYALEHWHPDSYVAVVFHRGELTEEQQAVLATLQPQDDGEFAGANLVVQTVDLDAEPDETMISLWEDQETDVLPWVVVNSPLRQGPPTTVWSGELTGEHQSALLKSPIRDELGKRLLSGDSVVWVCLDSGDVSADEDAWNTVTTEVERLENELELPEIEEADLDDLSLDPAALKLKMSAIRVSRDDAAESFLVASLLRVEPDLLNEPFVNQPMAFPVFGRGRALYALVGDGIAPDTIKEASEFLTGACQCTVKAQNPGVDMLMAVDWDRHIIPALPYDDSQPELAGLGSFANADSTEAPSVQPEEPLDDAQPVEDSDSELSTTDATPTTNLETESEASTELSAPIDAPLPSTSSREAVSTGLTGSVLLVVGLLAMCVIVATIVLIPRSR
ncbi:MAG: hypothetical protein KDA52_08510 [Planctomycetaceae bacterium]|nr:hypothetical protein [Planctomycetaceae bacterium]